MQTAPKNNIKTCLEELTDAAERLKSMGASGELAERLDNLSASLPRLTTKSAEEMNANCEGFTAFQNGAGIKDYRLVKLELRKFWQNGWLNAAMCAARDAKELKPVIDNAANYSETCSAAAALLNRAANNTKTYTEKNHMSATAGALERLSSELERISALSK